MPIKAHDVVVIVDADNVPIRVEIDGVVIVNLLNYTMGVHPTHGKQAFMIEFMPNSVVLQKEKPDDV